LFLAFCASIDAAGTRRGSARRIRGHAAFFTTLDRECIGAYELTQERLLDLFGADVLRRSDLPVRFIARRLALSWDAGAGAAHSDRRRMARTSAAAGDRPWADDLEAYREHLAGGREIGPGTARMYTAAAANLLHGAGVARATELTQAHVRRYLHRHRGRRTNIMRFLSWVSGRSGASYDVGKGRRTPPRKRERRTLRKAVHLLDRLASTRDEREGRAVLAAAIALLHHLSLKRVLALQRRDVAADGDAVTLWPNEEHVELAAPLAAGFVRFATLGSLAFPGRNGVQPLTASAVRHHVRPVPPRRQQSKTIS
jgi:hypothetical protein